MVFECKKKELSVGEEKKQVDTHTYIFSFRSICAWECFLSFFPLFFVGGSGQIRRRRCQIWLDLRQIRVTELQILAFAYRVTQCFQNNQAKQPPPLKLKLLVVVVLHHPSFSSFIVFQPGFSLSPPSLLFPYIFYYICGVQRDRRWKKVWELESGVNLFSFYLFGLNLGKIKQKIKWNVWCFWCDKEQEIEVINTQRKNNCT